MPKKDLYHAINPVQSIAPQAVTAPIDGAIVDLKGFLGATVIIDVGTFAGTSPSATIKIQESADGTEWSDVAAEDLLGGALPTIDTTNDTQVIHRGYIGTKRYLRVSVTDVSGTSASLPMSAMVVRHHKRYEPATPTP